MTEYLALICAASLLLAMVACLEIGRRYALSQAESSEAAAAGKRIVEGGFFAFMSLLIAFSFSGAVSRFDTRRAQIVEEANNIQTAYMRVEMLAPSAQPKMRDLFRSYLDERLAVFSSIPDMQAVQRHLDQSTALQKEMWASAVSASREPGGHPNAGLGVTYPINSLIEIANKRNWGALTHPPIIIYALLFVIALICSFIAGNSLADGRSRSWSHVLGFALLTCISVYVILEIEFPRIGFFGIDQYDQALIDIRKSMN